MLDFYDRRTLDGDLDQTCEGLHPHVQQWLRREVAAIIVALLAGRDLGESLQDKSSRGGANLRGCRKIKIRLPDALLPLAPATAADPEPRWRLVYRLLRVAQRDGSRKTYIDVVSVGVRAEESAYQAAAARLRAGSTGRRKR